MIAVKEEVTADYEMDLASYALKVAQLEADVLFHKRNAEGNWRDLKETGARLHAALSRACSERDAFQVRAVSAERERDAYERTRGAGSVGVTEEALEQRLARVVRERDQALVHVTELQAAATANVFARRVEFASRVREFRTVVLRARDPAEPTSPTSDALRTQVRLLVEEFFEVLSEVFAIPARWRAADLLAARVAVDFVVEASPIANVDVARLAGELADVAFLVEGTFALLGVDSGPILAEVARANLAKIGGVVSPCGKLSKPEGWSPPYVAGLVDAQRRRDEG